jgi:DNA-binding FadR family transcriptional regulator
MDFAQRLGQGRAMSKVTSSLGRGEGPIVRRKLSDQVLDRLKAMIASGDYAPGQTLPSERELMAAFGVGRPAIREAMQALCNAGLISINHGERARVRPVTAKTAFRQFDLVAETLLSASPDLVTSLAEARRSFEEGLVREAARKVDAADLEQLGALLDAQAEALKSPNAFLAADLAVHQRLIGVLRNPIFDAMVEGVLAWLAANHLDAERLCRAGREVLRANTAIVQALKTRDADAAQAAMADYFERIGAA